MLGDTVVDCFGGIAGTALDAMWNGLTWVGCELEPRFVGLAQQNIDLWSRKYGSKPGFGSARILQGDSRKLASVIAGADLVCSSPPYVDQATNGARPNRAANLAAAGIDADEWLGERRCTQGRSEGYGASPGQLGAMKEGEPPTVDLVCSSPPYAAIATGAGGLNTKPGKDGQQSGRSAASPSQDTDQRYGETAGQLAVMREGEAPACIVSSPPYAGSEQSRDGDFVMNSTAANPTERRLDTRSYFPADMSAAGSLGAMPEGRFDAVVSSPPYEGQQVGTGAEGRTGWRGYTDMGGGTTARSEQLSAMVPDTFWQAAREIVAQCHAILRPGGHAIWITKRFIRRSEIVEFSDQWLALCRSVGFDLVCRHRAMLVANYGEQDDIFGGTKELKTERKSFFRRLHEKRPGAEKIDWEDVLCLIKK